MAKISIACLLKNTDLSEKIKQLIPILNLQIGQKNGKPTFRQVRQQLIKETGVEIDMDSFAEMYKSEIPPDLRFTSDEEIEEIIGAKTKLAFEKLAEGTADRLDGIGETSTDRAAINKAAGILTTIEGKDKSVRTKTISKVVKDAVLSQIQRLANSNEDFKELRKRDTKESFEQVVEKLLQINSLRTKQVEADKFNTVNDVWEQSKQAVLDSMKDLRDEDGNPLLGEEGVKFLEQYKNSVIGVLMSTGDANTLIRGALLEAGYGKGKVGSQTVDWKKLSGEINNPHIVREKVIAALQEGKGLSVEAATSIADSLANEFADLAKGQKAMDAKYSIAESLAKKILNRLGQKLPDATIKKINEALRSAIDKSVAESDTLKVGEIVHDVMRDVAKISETQLKNLPERSITITSHTADKIAKIVKGDGLLDADAEAELYKTLGKSVDQAVIEELRILSKLKEDIENVDIKVNPENDTITQSKQGLEKAKLIQTISDRMARIVARSADYSNKSLFYQYTTFALNALSKYTSANAALVLLNPFNLTQNLLSGAFVPVQGKVGGFFADKFGKYQTPLIYKNEDGDKIDLSGLLNKVGVGETWWNSFLGAQGRDIPDLFTGDVSKETKTFKTAETTGDKVEAALTALPRAALTATDAALKEPYFRQEFIRGLLYHLQASGGKTKDQAQKIVYEALTKNTEENLMASATKLAKMVDKGADKFYIKQVAEDIRMSSLILLQTNEDGTTTSLLSEDHLKSIVDAATRVAGENFGHIIQKDVAVFSWMYDWLTGGKAKAIEALNREQGEKMADYYSKGQYREAAWLHFTHSFKSTLGFLFQRGIYNWAILMAQKNPVSIVRGFKALSRDASFNDSKGSQMAVENFLRARAKIGRGVMGTATAMAIVPLVMAALGSGGSDEERKKRLAALKKDPVWGRLYRNFVSPSAQAFIDFKLSGYTTGGAATGFADMFIQPVVSAGARYYSADNVLMNTVENLSKGKTDVAGKDFAGIASIFLPAKGFLNTNKAWVERVWGKGSPDMIENGQVVIDDRKPAKADDFWDAFWYTSLLKKPK